MTVSEFVFELHVCRWAELSWEPACRDDVVLVARQLGTKKRRWDTIIFECDSAGFSQRAKFGQDHLDSDLLHVIRHAPPDWRWYRDALPKPSYPWRYVREAVHSAADRNIIETRKQHNRIELRRRFVYPDWVNRVIAIENKPDMDASAASNLASQLEFDIAMGLADEVWLATEFTDTRIPPSLLEAMPVEAGIIAIEPATLQGEILWHPRTLTPEEAGTRILERPTGAVHDHSAARFEYITPAEKSSIRRQIAERAWERGWRSAIDSMRPDCRHFTLALETLTHEPRCRAKEKSPSTAECSGRCEFFEPEPPGWRTRGWPIEGGPGKAMRWIWEEQLRRCRSGHFHGKGCESSKRRSFVE